MDFIQVVSSREFQAAVLILASFTAAVVSLFKSHYFLKTLRRKLSTQDYVNAKELVKEVDNGSHPFVIEKAYQAVSGDSSLNAKEVTYLLSLPSPSQTLEKYTSSSKYLQFVPEGQEHSDRILFKDHYDKSKIKRAKFFRAAEFFFFALLAFALFALCVLAFDQGLSYGLFLLVATIFYGFLCCMSFREFCRIEQAEELVQMQQSMSSDEAKKALSR